MIILVSPELMMKEQMLLLQVIAAILLGSFLFPVSLYLGFSIPKSIVISLVVVLVFLLAGRATSRLLKQK